MNKYNYSVYIGRFSPIHNGHERSIRVALDVADKAIIIIGSANAARDLRNPFTENERATMIRSLFTPEENARILIGVVEDTYYQNTLWLANTQDSVNQLISGQGWSDSPPSVALVGYKKDHTSDYLNDFKHWDFIDTEMYRGDNLDNHSHAEILHSTEIRNLYFTGKMSFLRSAVASSVFDFMKSFSETAEYAALKEDYANRIAEEACYAAVPKDYAINAYCADAVVIQSGHILLVRRGADIGKNTLALPGGHVKATETARKAAIRKLIEETSINLQPHVLERNIRDSHLFDHPERSLRYRVNGPRGRTVTVAHYIHLDSSRELPRVRGADDALEAVWIPLGDIRSLKNQFFEDHFSIINYFIHRHNIS